MTIPKSPLSQPGDPHPGHRSNAPTALDPVGGAAATSDPFIQKTFNIGPAPLERGLVFVIMSFQGDGMDVVYAAIQAACKKCGLRARRVDESVGSGFVIKEIGSLIQQAEFIVCDLSHERPNVYYELGYAHGIGNGAENIVLTARQGTPLHFDIAPLRVNYYSSTDELQSVLVKNLGAMVQSRNPQAPRLVSPAARPR